MATSGTRLSVLVCVALITGEKENPAAAAIIEASREGRTQGSRDLFSLKDCKKASCKKADLGMTLIRLKQVLWSRPAATPDGRLVSSTTRALGVTKSPSWRDFWKSGATLCLSLVLGTFPERIPKANGIYEVVCRCIHMISIYCR